MAINYGDWWNSLTEFARWHVLKIMSGPCLAEYIPISTPGEFSKLSKIVEEVKRKLPDWDELPEFVQSMIVHCGYEFVRGICQECFGR